MSQSKSVVFLDLSYLNSTGAHHLGKELLNSTRCILLFLSIKLIKNEFGNTCLHYWKITL